MLSKFKQVKPIGKRLLGIPKRRWEDDIGVDFKEIAIIMRNRLIRLRIGIIREPL